jgi:hypothetical protein
MPRKSELRPLARAQVVPFERERMMHERNESVARTERLGSAPKARPSIMIGHPDRSAASRSAHVQGGMRKSGAQVLHFDSPTETSELGDDPSVISEPPVE